MSLVKQLMYLYSKEKLIRYKLFVAFACVLQTFSSDEVRDDDGCFILLALDRNDHLFDKKKVKYELPDFVCLHCYLDQESAESEGKLQAKSE